MRLEKPPVNISNLTGGKNEKARRGLYMKNFTGNNEWKSK